MTTVKKAQVAEVNAGVTQIEGMLFEDNTFGVSIPQICDLFEIDGHNANRYLKTLLGGELEVVKAKAPHHVKPANAVSLDTFRKILRKLDKAGNPVAEEIEEATRDLVWHQLFCDAFCIKFEKEERELWLKTRNNGKKGRRVLTDAIKAANDNGAAINYGLATIEVYKICGLYERYEAHEANTEDKREFRDTLNPEELSALETLERCFAAKLNSGCPFGKARTEVALAFKELSLVHKLS